MRRIKLKPRQKAKDLYNDLFSKETEDEKKVDLDELIDETKHCSNCGSTDILPKDTGGIFGEGVGKTGSIHTKLYPLGNEYVCQSCGIVIVE